MTASPFALLRDRAADGDVETNELALTRTGDRYRLTVAGTTHTDLTEETLRATLREHSAALREWAFWYERAPQDTARWAFLRWLEAADTTPPPARRAALTEGTQRTWGQLHLTVRLDDEDRRVYALRHVDDADRPPEQLDRHSDPRDARALATYDDQGRYRPLSTAPTLRTGWIFTGLDASAAVRTVDFFYPATIANWHRERTGNLDVTHWNETTARQTGIYAVTAELEGQAVDWVAEACCVDSQCLKRRRWDERADRELDVPRGEAVFPCREPCSLVIAAARKWAFLEREDEQTYTLRLTPAEKEQLETLLEAVAEGTVEDIREADVENGANRYRVRYLRAKRTNDAGRLGAEPSDDGS